MTTRNNIPHDNSNRRDNVDGSSSDEVNVQITANEYGTVQAVVDDPRYDRNSINSVESQDDACFSDNSGEECQTLLSTKNIFKSAENNARLNQANLIDRQPTIQL
ncbi:unnamed protein product [Rotaria sp. Silwood1]|nr:unnamed protein product [Rotaria sp. Silwood1]